MMGALDMVWRILTLFARLLFVCRVSLLSGLGGLLLFWQVVQAQDLLADLSHGGLGAAWWHWFKFFSALWVIWAFPVHYAARRAVDDDGWIVRAGLRTRLPAGDVARIVLALRRDNAWLLRWLPRTLGLLPFLAVLIGLLQVSYNLKDVNIDEATKTKELITTLGIACLCESTLFVFFMIKRQSLIQRTQRRLAEQNDPGMRLRRNPLAVLTVFCLGATLALYAFAYLMPHVIAAAMPRAALVPLLFGSLVIPLGYLGRAAHRHGVPYLFVLGLTCAVLTGFNLRFNDLRGMPVLGEVSQRQITVDQAALRWRTANGCSGEGAICPPALIVAAEGGASRAAFMTATVIGAILDQTAATGPGDPGRRIFAISGVSGGAVGAALVRAALADAADGGGGKPPCRYVDDTWYRAEEFRNSPRVPASWRECLQMFAAGDFLSPAFVGLAFRDNFAPPIDLISPKLGLRDRAVLLEQAFERHYAAIAGAPAEPCLRPGKGLCRVFGYPIGTEDSPTTAWLPLLALNGTSVQSGRRIVTNDLRAGTRPDNTLYTQAYDLFEMRSSPCKKVLHDTDGNNSQSDKTMLSNGSVRNGVIVREDLIDAALGQCPEAQPIDAPDLYLSTAALTSARFPIISPAGVIETGSHDLHGDAVVDGGYFENGGLTTALDIARAVSAQGLTPVILSIVNEPEAIRPDQQTPPRTVTTPTVRMVAWHALLPGLTMRVFGLLGAPIDTLYGTRGGHGAEALERVKRALPGPDKAEDEATPRLLALKEPIGSHFTIRMQGEVLAEDSMPKDRCPGGRKAVGMPTLSMSWWLSAVVQGDIDVQVLCTGANKKELGRLLKILGLDPVVTR